MMNAPRLSACMVLYHSGPQALEAVRSVAASDVPVELYIVNNAPEDDSLTEPIRAIFPDAIFLTPEKNLGFGRGNNMVLPHIRSRYHLMLNPDVTFPPDLLRRMTEYLDAHSEASVLTPRVFNPDGTEQFLPKFQPTVRYLLGGRLEKYGAAFRALRTAYTLRDKVITEPTQVGFATGCFLMIRTAMFTRLKGFDPRFFLYQEDSDLSMRVMQNGGQIIYHPDMQITHVWARENTKTLKGNLHQIRSIMKYAWKWGLKW